VEDRLSQTQGQHALEISNLRAQLAGPRPFAARLWEETEGELSRFTKTEVEVTKRLILVGPQRYRSLEAHLEKLGLEWNRASLTLITTDSSVIVRRDRTDHYYVEDQFKAILKHLLFQPENQRPAPGGSP
jgi:hypothetical protein